MIETRKSNWQDAAKIREELKSQGFISSTELYGRDEDFRTNLGIPPWMTAGKLKKCFENNSKLRCICLDYPPKKYWYLVDDLKQIINTLK